MNNTAMIGAELAHRVLRGDRGAEAELVARFQKGVRQVIVRMTGNLSLAEELTQETFIVTLRRLRSVPLQDPTKLAAFIAQTARNLAIAEKRKERRRRTDTGGQGIEQLPGAEDDEDRWAEAASAAWAVRVVLKELPSERDRGVLIRHYLHDEDRTAICRDLGIKESAFNVILFRARKRFLEKLVRRGIGRADLFSPTFP
ncbi:MAG TPA: sigma-70 family RNA polymerase sigma factor [Steroidobacteraceae bacterium]|nr:sigma-70 family RNA polymerase sigma factor [Steroidobacteraceae bacterium]